MVLVYATMMGLSKRCGELLFLTVPGTRPDQVRSQMWTPYGHYCVLGVSPAIRLGVI